MFRARMYRMQKDVVLAASDEELIGRTLSFGAVTVEVTEDFYGDEEATLGELANMLAECTVANLIGANAVGLAVRLGLVEKTNVISIDGVPHAQIARMR